jgi:methyl-accepting chemotaxis protein
MLRYLRNLGFQTKLRIFILGLLIILFSFAAVLVYHAQKTRILNTASESVEIFLDDLTAILEISSLQFNSLDANSPVYENLKSVFLSRNYFPEGRVYLIGMDGTYMLHHVREGKNGIQDNANELMLRTLSSRGSYRFYDSQGNLYRQHFRLFEPYKTYIVITYPEDILLQSLGRSRNMLVLLVFISVTLALTILYLLLRPFSKTLNELDKVLNIMSAGELVEELQVRSEDEVGKIVHSVNKLIVGLKQTTDFSVQIGEGNLDSQFQPLSNKDVLGNSMLQMRESLKYAAEEEKKRKKEDNERNWVAMGLAKFGEILRTNYNSTKELGEMVIQNLVKYLDANQGGIFQLNDENESDTHLELVAAFAYDRNKYLNKKILIGEGLVGACAIEKQTIYMTQIPQGYISITSGLGDSNPDCLLIVPLKLEDKIYGVIEIASFKKLENYQVEFVEKVAESIASTLSAVKVNTQTTMLLQQSQQQAEEMAAQEEEMRQNMEELQATQEESARREFELMNLVISLDKHFLRAEFSRAGNMLSSNELFLNTLEHSASELQSKNIASMITGENDDTFLPAWQSISSGNDYQGVVSVKTGKGNKAWLLVSFSAVYDRDGNLMKILCFAKDITALKADEVQLRQEIRNFEEMKTDWQRSLKNLKKK